MIHDSKANYLMYLFTQEKNFQHDLNQKQIKILSKELDIMSALDNNGMLTDSMLDEKNYENYSACDDFFSAIEDVIMEQ